MKTNNNQGQVGGNHYERLQIEPVEIIVKCNLSWFQGETLKYISRYPWKGGKNDLIKAKHILSMAVEYNENFDFLYNFSIEEYLEQFKKDFFINPASLEIFEKLLSAFKGSNYRKEIELVEQLIISEYGEE